MVSDGVVGVVMLFELVVKMMCLCVVWLMVLVVVVDGVLDDLIVYLDLGDIIIDGGNFYY